jgi:hypothetical protein
MSRLTSVPADLCEQSYNERVSSASAAIGRPRRRPHRRLRRLALDFDRDGDANHLDGRVEGKGDALRHLDGHRCLEELRDDFHVVHTA